MQQELDIWNNNDAFGFIQQEWSGDASIVVKVNSLTNTNQWAKAGIMIRDTNDTDSAHAMIVVTPERGVSFQRRLSAGDRSYSTTYAGVKAPQWLKLIRTGNVIRSYFSADGGTWMPLGKATVDLQTNVQVGLVLTSHDAGKTATASYYGYDVKDPQDELIINKFILVNADTDEDIKEIFHNETIDLLQLGHNISIKVEVNDKPGSIVFNVDGEQFQVENNPGYYIAGNSGSDVDVWEVSSGPVSVEATPKSESGGSGVSGETLKIKLNIKK